MVSTKQSAPTGGGGAQEAIGGASTVKYSTTPIDCQPVCKVLRPALVTCARNCCDPRYLVLLRDLVALTARWAR